MKIAFITEAFPTLSETFILNQITGLIDAGHSINIIAGFNPGEGKVYSDKWKHELSEQTYYSAPPRNIIRCVLKAIYLVLTNFHKGPLKISRSLNIFKYGREAASLSLLYTLIPFLDKKFDILHCHFGPVGIIGSYLKDIGVSGKLLVTFHGYDMSEFIERKGENVYNKLFSIGHLFLPVSVYWERRLIELGCNKEKVKVHRMGINLEKFQFKKRKLRPGEPVKIVTVGRLVEKKGHEFAIQAMEKLLDGNINIDYKIVGDGPLREKLNILVAEKGLSDCVEFLGSLEQKDVIELCGESHIFLLPSITASNGDKEGIPVVLMEAQAMGMPVVATMHSGIPEAVVDGKTGFLVPERDVSALAERLEYLIMHPGKWPAMGVAGKEHINNYYNIRKLNFDLMNLYQSLLTEPDGKES